MLLKVKFLATRTKETYGMPTLQLMRTSGTSFLQ